MEELFEAVFEVVGGDRSFGGVGYGFLAEVVEGEGPGRGEAAAPGLIQDETHQIQGDFGLALVRFARKVHGEYYTDGRERYGRIQATLSIESARFLSPREAGAARGEA